VSLTPKTFDVLLALVESAGEVVGKDELMRRVWPDSFVEEVNLAYHISLLRKALGESRNERQYIVTISGRGYSFVAEVKELQVERAELIVHQHTRSSLTIEEEIETDGSDKAHADVDLALSQRGSIDGQRLKQDWKFEANGERSIQPDSNSVQASAETAKQSAVSAATIETSRAELIPDY